MADYPIIPEQRKKKRYKNRYRKGGALRVQKRQRTTGLRGIE